MTHILPKLRLGYTIIELMITISIVAVLVGFGLSAYGRARDRQVGQSAAEIIVSLLRQNQQEASIGKKDNTKCIDGFLGQQVRTYAGTATISSQSLCNGGNGDLITTTLSGITFDADQTITFPPLTSGIDLDGASELFIDFTGASNLVYRIRLTAPGTIEYQGIQ